MTWSTAHDLEEFTAAAGEFLRAQPARNTLMLSIMASLRASGPRAYGSDPPLFGWWREAGGQATGAFLQTPPFPLLLSSAPDQAVRELAKTLAGAGRMIPGVNSGGQAAGQFAAEWQRQAGGTFAVQRQMRLYRLARLVPPDPAPPGRARVAAAADRELLAHWFEACMLEIGEMEAGVARAHVQVADRLSYGGLTLWESGGAPVSFAAVTRAVTGVVRVGPVYTPPGQRRRGYAAGVTAAVSGGALAAGADEVLLFTDLANPTSNAIYQRIGYEPVEDRVVLAFAS
jgi:hypothetical protein